MLFHKQISSLYMSFVFDTCIQIHNCAHVLLATEWKMLFISIFKFLFILIYISALSLYRWGITIQGMFLYCTFQTSDLLVNYSRKQACNFTASVLQPKHCENCNHAHMCTCIYTALEKFAVHIRFKVYIHNWCCIVMFASIVVR